MIDGISSAFDFGFVIDVYQPCSANFPPMHCFPYIEALHVQASRHFSPFLKYIAVRVSDKQALSQTSACLDPDERTNRQSKGPQLW
jgi:hypothetical protein